jgi:4-cresol dehydrogenase (hydroxylating)
MKMLQQTRAEFWTECQAIVGGQNMLVGLEAIEAYTRSVSAEKRHLLGVVRPGNTEEVQLLVKLARHHKQPLYPISTGKNWGLGSRLPARDGCVIVDLGRMNRIREVNAEFSYAVVEPGVTQRQLYQYLVERNLPYHFDVIGSAADTSIVGNILEGGVGYIGLRFEAACNYEVVTGMGHLLQTGFGHYQNAATRNLHKYGIGPSLDGLFMLSNLGIVTALTIALIPKPEYHVAAVMSIARNEDLEEFVDRLMVLKRRRIVSTTIKIGNKARSRTTLCPLMQRVFRRIETDPTRQTREFAEQVFEKNFGAWSAVAGLSGPKSMVQAATKELQAVMDRFAKVRFVDDHKFRVGHWLTEKLGFLPAAREQYAILQAVYPLYQLTQGIPSDETMPSLWWPLAGDVPEDCRQPDVTNVGMIAYLPIIPASGHWAVENAQATNRCFRSFGFEPAMTMSIINDRFMWGVTDLSFDRADPRQVVSAKRAIAELEADMADRGIYPQRIGIDSMEIFVRPDDPYWMTVKRLKTVFDGQHIIAPGRYNLI